MTALVVILSEEKDPSRLAGGRILRCAQNDIELLPAPVEDLVDADAVGTQVGGD